jgi:hypothetical protein
LRTRSHASTDGTGWRRAASIADLTGADDRFAADDVVEVAGVKATSMHAAAFALAERSWNAAQLSSLSPRSVSQHQEESGHPYTRITSAVNRRAPTETAWSADVWRQVREQLLREPSVDLQAAQARLTLERGRATRRLESRFGVLLTGAGVIAISIPSPVTSVSAPATTADSAEMATTQEPPPSAPGNDPPFIPSELHERILAALDQKALTLDALAAKLKVERSALYRDGIKELRQRGRIANHRRVGGYYRADALPPKYADGLSKQPP